MVTEKFYEELPIKNGDGVQLSTECLSIIVEFLKNMTEINQFNLVSYRHREACRSFLQLQFRDLRTIIEPKPRQQRIKSWMDIEEQIPIVPELYINFFRGTNDRVSYYSLLQFHEDSKSPIVRGLTKRHKVPFLSLLVTTETNIGPDYSIVICIFAKAKIQRSFIFDEHRYPRFLSLYLEDLDVLLDGHSLRFVEAKRKNRGRVMLRRYWKLMEQTSAKNMISGTSRVDGDTSHDRHQYYGSCVLCHEYPCLWTVVFVSLFLVLTAIVMSFLLFF